LTETSEVAAERVGATAAAAETAAETMMTLAQTNVPLAFRGFPAMDHQILTRWGYYGLEEFQTHFKRWANIEVACVVEKKKIVYKKISASNLKEHTGDHALIRLKRPPLDHHHSSTIVTSIVTTAENTVLSKTCHTSARSPGSDKRSIPSVTEKKTAFTAQTLQAIQLSGRTENRSGVNDYYIKIQSQASEGYTPDTGLLPFAEDLDLQTVEEQNAFLELYGYWLGDGSMWCGPAPCISFGPVKATDWVYLDGLFEVLKRTLPIRGKGELKDLGPVGVLVYPLPETHLNKHGHRVGDKARSYFIKQKSWVDYFQEEYRSKYGDLRTDRPAVKKLVEALKKAEEEKLTEAALATNKDANNTGPKIIIPIPETKCKSAKWFYPWVLRSLNMSQSRLVLAGLRFADGNPRTTPANIYTSSPRFRDEIVHLCMHAGFTATYQRRKPAGTQSVMVKNGKETVITSKHDHYDVTYSATRLMSMTPFQIHGNCHDEVHQGTVWNVDVPTDVHQIFVRMALTRNEHGVITSASRPIIAGDASYPVV
tara:strand:+ start:195 stop:1808 length:1614 start_codon:yes stop_codon:yes gene_type:complete